MMNEVVSIRRTFLPACREGSRRRQTWDILHAPPPEISRLAVFSESTNSKIATPPPVFNTQTSPFKALRLQIHGSLY